MMVLEVNNTFGERRLYLLKAEENASDESVPDGFEAPAKATKFTNAWVKDFHVSPFNSRKGTYSLTAADPVAALKTGSKVLDNVVVLNSSKAHAKLVARVYSDGDHMDPATMSTSQALRLLASWFWVGFLTFPRIIAQAYQLYFKRKMHVWFRPEVLASSIGRTHTLSEAILEAFFRAYLGSLVDNASAPLRLTYTPAGGLGESVIMMSKEVKDDDQVKELTVRVISPAFYTRFVHYSHTTEAFDRESLHTDPKNRTLVSENAENLPLLLSSSTSSSTTKPNLGKIDRYRWQLLQRLRSPPPATAYPDSDTTFSDRASVQDIRKMPSSPLDHFAVSLLHDDGRYSDAVKVQILKNASILLHVEETTLAAVYRDTVTKVFIADTYLLGFEGLMSVIDLIVRILLVVVWFKFFATGEIGKMKLEKGERAWTVFGWKLCAWVVQNGVHLWYAVKSA